MCMKALYTSRNHRVYKNAVYSVALLELRSDTYDAHMGNFTYAKRRWNNFTHFKIVDRIQHSMRILHHKNW